VLGIIGFLILAAAIAWVWRNPMPPQTNPALAQAQAVLDTRVAALGAQVRGLDAQVAALAARKPPPEPKPVDLGPIEARLAAIENRPPPAAAPPADMATKADVAALGARVDAIAGEQASVADLTKRVAALEAAAQASGGELAATRQAVASLQSGAARTTRLARLQAAAADLDAGAPLGAISGAPPALARYADTPPPTISTLRLAYPAAARAAARASRPDLSGKPLLGRMWARVQNVVTVRQGDRIVLGDPASGTLAAAQTALDAGDLAGAVKQLDTLHGPAAAAMGGWLGQARALLAARDALATMQAHA
jgi:hypothetical protein